ncbi:MAG: hypothetical protein Q4B28_04495 [bacterium]|nr:hypothetical protein [bacterium]
MSSTVTLTWNGTAWSTPAQCSWTCNAGYTKQGNSCVANAPVCDTANGFSLHNGHCAKWKCKSAFQ